MNVAVSAAIAINCYLLLLALPSNAQPYPLPEMESSPVGSPFQSDPEDEFSERWFLLRLHMLDRQNQPELVMQLASLGLRMHQDSIRLRVAYAKAGTAAGRCDWVRQHLLLIRKNATSNKFRQLARDLIYRCFGGWKHYLAAGAVTGKRHSINGRSNAATITAEPGSRFYNQCLVYRGFCNPDRHIHISETRRSAIDLWGYLAAILHRETGADFTNQIVVQMFRRSPSKARFQAKGVALSFYMRRPVTQRTYLSFEMEAGAGEFQRGTAETDLNQQHLSVAGGLGHRLVRGWPEFIWQIEERRSFSGEGTTRHAVLGTKIRRLWDNDWLGELGVERIVAEHAPGAARPDPVADVASASLRFPLASKGAVLPGYRVEGEARLSKVSEQFSRPFFYLASQHADVTSSSAVSLSFVPESSSHPKIEIAFRKDRIETPNPLIPKQANNITLRFYFYKFSS